MKKLLEKVIRWYFRRYHKEKLTEMFIPKLSEWKGGFKKEVTASYFEPMDIVENYNGKKYLYLGNCEYLDLKSFKL